MLVEWMAGTWQNRDDINKISSPRDVFCNKWRLFMYWNNSKYSIANWNDLFSTLRERINIWSKNIEYNVWYNEINLTCCLIHISETINSGFACEILLDFFLYNTTRACFSYKQL